MLKAIEKYLKEEHAEIYLEMGETNRKNIKEVNIIS